MSDALKKAEEDAAAEEKAKTAAVMARPPWGFMCDGEFIELPKRPLVLGGFYGPCPFDVTMPDGSIRTIVEKPDDRSKNNQG